MQMCQALTQNGHSVTLFCRHGDGSTEPTKGSIHQFYDVSTEFDIVWHTWPHIPFGGMVYGYQVLQNLRRCAQQIDLLYARCVYSAFLANCLGIPLILELHELPRTWFHRRLQSSLSSSRHLSGLVFISRALYDDYAGVFPGVCARVATHIAPDAAARVAADRNVRESLGRTNAGDSPRVVYTGSLLPGKGAEIVIALAHKCPHCHFHILGGTPADWEQTEKNGIPENIFYHGFQPPAQVRRWQTTADVLLLPNQKEVFVNRARVDIGRWTSPLKMFEYMASGVPLIASDLPVLREILRPDHNCLMVPPSDVDAWSHAIERLTADSELGRQLAANARTDIVERYNWPTRAKTILDQIGTHTTIGR